MNYIFWGFFFAVLNFYISINTVVIDFIPTFVGYILMYKGLKILASFSPRFEKIKTWTIAMAIFMGIVYLTNLLGITARFYNIYASLGFGASVVGLYIQFNVAMGIKDIELTQKVFLNADTLILLWKLLAVGIVLTYVTQLLPSLSLMIIILALAAEVLFLYYLSRARRAFDAAQIL